jgi:hypothetical protein
VDTREQRRRTLLTTWKEKVDKRAVFGCRLARESTGKVVAWNRSCRVTGGEEEEEEEEGARRNLWEKRDKSKGRGMGRLLDRTSVTARSYDRKAMKSREEGKEGCRS